MWNERHAVSNRENVGVYRLLCVNMNGIRQLREKLPLMGRLASTRRLLWVNVLKMQGCRSGPSDSILGATGAVLRTG